LGFASLRFVSLPFASLRILAALRETLEVLGDYWVSRKAAKIRKNAKSKRRKVAKS
jgi:hypothetical protein